MTGYPLVLILFTIIVALIFDLVNGFHDAANSIATVVSTRVLRPGTAVLWAAFFNFAAMFIFAPRVAESISNIVKVQPSDYNYIYVVLCGLLSAIAWDLLTWWLKLPTSSSHALIGGFTGAGVAYGGWDVISWDTILEIAIFIVLSPLAGFILGFGLMWLSYFIFRHAHPYKVDEGFRKGQLFSAALYSIGHGANDAQKTMGIIVALLIASGSLPAGAQLTLTNPKTAWIIFSCHAAIALGTALGGWRIVKTMGMRLTKLKPMGGFCAESGGAATLFAVSYLGIPVSTTQTITGSIIGVGTLANKFSGVRWGIAAQVLWAWLLTLPMTALLAAIFWHLSAIMFQR
jgi:PiT family inorganic phosphate transporter